MVEEADFHAIAYFVVQAPLHNLFLLLLLFPELQVPPLLKKRPLFKDLVEVLLERLVLVPLLLLFLFFSFFVFV